MTDADLALVQLDRAFTDPIILYEPHTHFAPRDDNAILDAVTRARLAQACAADGRIQWATWPEVALYCAEASGDARMCGPDLVNAYSHSLRMTLTRWFDHDPSGFPNPIAGPTEWEHGQFERVMQLRWAMKHDRDKHFLEHRYDDLDPSVPKAFWKDPSPGKLSAVREYCEKSRNSAESDGIEAAVTGGDD